MRATRASVNTFGMSAGAFATWASELILLVGPVGFEPTTRGLKVRCSTN